MGLFTELRRRNVFRVGVAYVVGAWLFAQVADLVFDVIGAPNIVLRSVVAVLALDFGHVDLNAVVEVEEQLGTSPVTNKVVER